MRVKMKVKHLVLSIVTGIVFLVIFISFLQPPLETWSISRQLASGETEQAKERIIENIESKSRNRLQLIEKYMISPAPGAHYDIYVSPSGIMGPGPEAAERYFTLEESAPYFLEYLEKGPAGDTHRKAADILSVYYYGVGDYENLSLTLQKAAGRYDNNSEHYHELKLRNIEQAVNFQEFEAAEALIDQYEKEIPESFPDARLQVAMLEARSYMLQDKTEEALAVLDAAMEDYREHERQLLEEMKEHDPEYTNEFQEESYYLTVAEDLKASIESMDDNAWSASMEGRITRSDGQPLANAGVFLKDEPNVMRTSPSPFGEKYGTVTGPDGSYSFHGVAPGSYQVQVGLLLEQVDGWSWPADMYEWVDLEAGEAEQYDIELTPLIEINSPKDFETLENETITFDWEDYPDAASYTIFLGIEVDGGAGSLSVGFMEEIPESQITFKADDLYAKTVGFSFGDEEWDSVQPESLLAFANVHGSYFWYVHAFDEDGEFIGQSNGYRLKEETMGALPFFQLQEREMTEADNLLMKGKVREALALYKADADDIHSLRMITRINGLDEKNEEETIEYQKKLYELAPDEGTLFHIIEYYFSAGDWTETAKWYSRYQEEVPEGKQSYYVKALYGITLTRLGELEEARSLFHEVMEEDRSNEYIGNLLALELYLGTERNKVLEMAQENKERFYEILDWTPLVENLESVEEQSLMEALKLSFEGDEKELERFLADKEPSLRNFISELKKR
ncbi:carboxypeptidase-like regulatory domain-containing protein [Evansella sp. LMS18]|uniref:carboxypeptidase-like regulatory domain-containing protein n=1 Tax=Evansella sp. LMS18 TaxID=2924033 RepID=UPI0020D1D08F|nr:carboxypeptidase-like regulatory domain-containing protein [Evansella sp. LMS18]UTR12807.1 carboxypeptidase-like regulatory domain-containing protein [Evansella sp. LMS18]